MSSQQVICDWNTSPNDIVMAMLINVFINSFETLCKASSLLYASIINLEQEGGTKKQHEKASSLQTKTTAYLPSSEVNSEVMSKS